MHLDEKMATSSQFSRIAKPEETTIEEQEERRKKML
jgi:hypothetical protein